MYDLTAHISSGQLYKGEFLFRYSPLTEEEQLNLRLNPIGSPRGGPKFKKVWVYNASTMEFIEEHDTVRDARHKYNVAKTSMNRSLNHGVPFKGLIFSRVKLD